MLGETRTEPERKCLDGYGQAFGILARSKHLWRLPHVLDVIRIYTSGRGLALELKAVGLALSSSARRKPIVHLGSPLGADSRHRTTLTRSCAVTLLRSWSRVCGTLGSLANPAARSTNIPPESMSGRSEIWTSSWQVAALALIRCPRSPTSRSQVVSQSSCNQPVPFAGGMIVWEEHFTA